MVTAPDNRPADKIVSWPFVIVTVACAIILFGESRQAEGQTPSCIAMLNDRPDQPVCITGRHVDFFPDELGRENYRTIVAYWNLASLDGKPIKGATNIDIERQSFAGGATSDSYSTRFARELDRHGVPIDKGFFQMLMLEPIDRGFVLTPRGVDQPQAVTIRIEPGDDYATYSGDDIETLNAELTDWFLGAIDTPVFPPLPPTGLTVSD